LGCEGGTDIPVGSGGGGGADTVAEKEGREQVVRSDKSEE
jgi:hypothetical protein